VWACHTRGPLFDATGPQACAKESCAIVGIVGNNAAAVMLSAWHCLHNGVKGKRYLSDLLKISQIS